MAGLLEGKTAVITGAGSGVGRAASLLFARHGAKIIAADVHLETLNETVAAVEAEGGECHAQICDVSQPEQVDQAIAAAVAAFGRLDIMYNNAGIAARTANNAGANTFTDGTLEQFRRMSEVNICGVINGMQSAIRQFRKQGGGGVIVSTASLAGLIGFGGPLYSATKGAVTTLTRSVATEVAAEGIRVNSVCPAMMLTPFGVGRGGEYPQAIRDWADKIHPLGRVIDPMDCANGALFLASDLASNITGHNLPVDGGLGSGVKI